MSGAAPARNPAPTSADLDAVSAQIGRTVRDVLFIAARVASGEPAVVATAPRLADGTPFPTYYYLTHPRLVRAMSHLEAEGRMRELGDRLIDDHELAAAYASAHRAYLASRHAAGDVAEVAGVSAGGMPTRVKCLHALAAHALAAGRGVNPIGDLALDEAAAADRRIAADLATWAQGTRV